MTSFEKYLIDQGYVKHRWTKSGLIPATDHVISTMVNLDHRYVHPDRPDKQIIFGLNEVGKPPTLIYPRPKSNISDNEMNRLLTDLSPEEILSKII